MKNHNEKTSFSFYKNLLKQIAFNENQFEKNERIKNFQVVQRQKSLNKLQMSKTLAKQIESQKFIEKLKSQVEKEKSAAVQSRTTTSSLAKFRNNTPESKRPNEKTPLKSFKSTKFHIKSEYLHKNDTFITQNPEFYQTFHNSSTFVKDDLKDCDYYSRFTYENISKWRRVMSNFNNKSNREYKGNKLHAVEAISPQKKRNFSDYVNENNQIIGIFFLIYQKIEKFRVSLEIRQKEKNLYELKQLEFYYFKIRIEKKESPLCICKNLFYLKNFSFLKILKITKNFKLKQK